MREDYYSCRFEIKIYNTNLENQVFSTVFFNLLELHICFRNLLQHLFSVILQRNSQAVFQVARY